MAYRYLPSRPQGTIQDFDGEPSKIPTGSGGGGDSLKEVVSSPQYAQTNLLLIALLDHLSTIYGGTGSHGNRLFKELVDSLVDANILQGFGALDEASSLRAQYKVAFSKILKSAIASSSFQQAAGIYDCARHLFSPRLNIKAPLVVPALSDIINSNTSRYHEDFAEIKKVGFGAYGNVYKVKNLLDNCEYAIKKISFESSSPDLWLKIINEVKLLAQLNHKHVIRYHNAWIEYGCTSLLRTCEQAGSSSPRLMASTNLPAITYEHSSHSGDQEESDDGIVFVNSKGRHLSPQSSPASNSPSSSSLGIVSTTSSDPSRPNFQMPRAVVVLHIQMELCTHTLKHWIGSRNYKDRHEDSDKYSVIDGAVNLQLLKQILKGLCFIHKNDLMHRDIKPQNIFLTPNENGGQCEVAKVGDFGLARHNSSTEPLTPHPGHISRHGCYTGGIGTAMYAAPEQLNGSTYTQKCDMYSMGLVLFEMYEPFSTEMERIDNLNMLRTGDVPTEFTKRWPEEAKYVKRLLSKDDHLRPSAAEMLDSELFNSRDQIIFNLRIENQELKNLLAKRDADIAMLRRQLVNARRKEHNLW